MEVSPNVYAFPLETTYFGNERTFYPAGVETPNGLYLFDVGGPNDANLLEAALGEHGFQLADVNKVFMTHHDYDHLGCLAAVADRGEFELVAHRNAAPYVAGEVRMIKRPNEDYPGVPVDFQLTGGAKFRTAAGDGEVIFTPGHAPGHVVYYFPDRKLLIAGDQLRSDRDYLSGPKRSVTPDLATARDSIGILTNLDLRTVLCFHGGPIDATDADVQRVYDSLASEV